MENTVKVPVIIDTDPGDDDAASSFMGPCKQKV